MYLGEEEWFRNITSEYLTTFIPWGGAAVKFLVPHQETEPAFLWHRLRREAEAGDLLFVHLDARRTKLHMIDKLFHAVAVQIDWDDLTRSFLMNLFQEKSYAVPEGPDGLNLKNLAQHNDVDEKELSRNLKQWLYRAILQDYQMCKEFRQAMTRLCWAMLDPTDVSPSLDDAVKEWLRGQLSRISALREALIFQKIARHNARYMMLSLAHWIRLAGKGGLVLGLDIRRYLVTARETDGTFYYGPTTTIDMYEVLRQFIDSTDELESLFMVVIAPPEFLSNERRGINKYDALKLRIWDEVHDERRVNPLGSLIRLAAPVNELPAGTEAIR